MSSKKKENLKGEFVAVVDRHSQKNQGFDEIELYKNELKKMISKFSPFLRFENFELNMIS